jgi:hypothetical protein
VRYSGSQREEIAKHMADLRSGPSFQHLRHLNDDRELVAAVLACVQQVKAAASRSTNAYSADARALERVSEEALESAMSHGDVSDIRTHHELSNCLVFHTTGLDGSVVDEEVMRLRTRVDQLVRERVRELITDPPGVDFVVSGHLFYRPGGYMGWHTNSRVPGWRIYVTYAEEPGKSFFRYRDPNTGKVVTSWDDGWDLRGFDADRRRPLWHSVYSGTNRFSFGYRLVSEGGERPGIARRVLRRLLKH